MDFQQLWESRYARALTILGPGRIGQPVAWRGLAGLVRLAGGGWRGPLAGLARPSGGAGGPGRRPSLFGLPSPVCLEAPEAALMYGQLHDTLPKPPSSRWASPTGVTQQDSNVQRLWERPPTTSPSPWAPIVIGLIDVVPRCAYRVRPDRGPHPTPGSSTTSRSRCFTRSSPSLWWRFLCSSTVPGGEQGGTACPPAPLWWCGWTLSSGGWRFHLPQRLTRSSAAWATEGPTSNSTSLPHTDRCPPVRPYR